MRCIFYDFKLSFKKKKSIVVIVGTESVLKGSRMF